MVVCHHPTHACDACGVPDPGSYRNGADVLVEWKPWKEEAWEICPFGSLDKAKCSARLCPCAVVQVNAWVNRLSGYLGTVKLVKYLHSRNGNGGGNGHGSGRTREDRQRTKAD